MPPLPPNVTKAGLVRSHGGWANSSLSRRSNTTRGLLSTRVPQSLGTTGGGVPNPSQGIGTIKEAMPKHAAGSARPVSNTATSEDTTLSYITYQGVRTYIQPVAGVIAISQMSDAYTRAGIDGDVTAHTLTFGSGAHTVGPVDTSIGSAAATVIRFVGDRSGDLTIGESTFARSAFGNVTSALTTLTFPDTVSGDLSIGQSAFVTSSLGGNAVSSLTTLTFPDTVGGTMTVQADAFITGSLGGDAETTLAVLTLPTTVGGNLSMNANSFGLFASGSATSALTTVTFPSMMDGLYVDADVFLGHTFIGATDAAKGVWLPPIPTSGVIMPDPPFPDASNSVVNGALQLNALVAGTYPAAGGRYYIA